MEVPYGIVTVTAGPTDPAVSDEPNICRSSMSTP